MSHSDSGVEGGGGEGVYECVCVYIYIQYLRRPATEPKAFATPQNAITAPQNGITIGVHKRCGV